MVYSQLHAPLSSHRPQPCNLVVPRWLAGADLAFFVGVLLWRLIARPDLSPPPRLSGEWVGWWSVLTAGAACGGGLRAHARQQAHLAQQQHRALPTAHRIRHEAASGGRAGAAKSRRPAAASHSHRRAGEGGAFKAIPLGWWLRPSALRMEDLIFSIVIDCIGFLGAWPGGAAGASGRSLEPPLPRVVLLLLPPRPPAPRCPGQAPLPAPGTHHGPARWLPLVPTLRCPRIHGRRAVGQDADPFPVRPAGGPVHRIRDPGRPEPVPHLPAGERRCPRVPQGAMAGAGPCCRAHLACACP